MHRGYVFEDEPFQYRDAYSGCRVTRLTDYLGHSNHLYFTDPCWFNDGRSFVFTSDRGNHSNLFRYDLDTFRITQLTDLVGRSIENERVFDHRPAGAYSAVNQKTLLLVAEHAGTSWMSIPVKNESSIKRRLTKCWAFMGSPLQMGATSAT